MELPCKEGTFSRGCGSRRRRLANAWQATQTHFPTLTSVRQANHLVYRTIGPFSRASDEALDERERLFGHLPPTAVDGERVTAVGGLFDLGDRRVLSLALERCVCDRPRHRVVLLPLDDQQRPAIRVLGIQLRLGPRV